jgi:transmembrane sensor
MPSSLDYLFGRYVDKTITPAERETFMQLLRESGHDMELRQLIDRMILEREGTHALSEETAASILEAIFRSGESLAEPGSPVLSMGTGKQAAGRSWPRWAAAALVLLLAGGSALYLAKSRHGKAVAVMTKRAMDVGPGGNRAKLTLADGTTIDLESAGRGALTRQGDAIVRKLDNSQLVYSDSHGKRPEKPLYNLVTVPRGGQYQVVLPDGTRVWLNAASSLRFPTAFTGAERQVELTGEGYFAVAGDRQHPFIVSFNHMQVQVLGTEFDVMAYNDEPAAQTTLATGSVRVRSGSAGTILEPGNMAEWKNNKFNVSHADVQQVTAWRSGEWSFENVDLPVIMRQLGRWYDIDIGYEGKIPEGIFGGEISRNVNLSTVLKFLESNGVHFRQDGRKLTILP